MGFALKHPSEIRYWYEAIAPQLGFATILDLLETYIKIEPETVSRAWYYLELMIKINSNDKSLYVPYQLIYSKSTNQVGTYPASAKVLEIDRKYLSIMTSSNLF